MFLMSGFHNLRYPVTWEGLYDLLDDADLTQDAEDFFDALEKSFSFFMAD